MIGVGGGWRDGVVSWLNIHLIASINHNGWGNIWTLDPISDANLFTISKCPAGMLKVFGSLNSSRFLDNRINQEFFFHDPKQ
jgi:hypothetical protein